MATNQVAQKITLAGTVETTTACQVCAVANSSATDGLRRGAVFHQAYPLCRAEVTAWDEQLLMLDGFSPTGRPPDHIIMSRGVDVTIFPLERY